MAIKNFFKFFIKDRLMVFLLLAGILINTIIWANLFRIKMVDGMIPLHYNIYFGIDYMGEWHNIFIVPLLGLIILIFNFLLSLFLYFKDKFISYILSIVASFVQIILLLASLAMVWINI